MEMCDLTANELCAWPIDSRSVRLPLICPCRAVLQPEIKLTYIIYSVSSGTIIRCILVIDRSTLPRRLGICQSHIQLTCIFPIYQLSATVFNDFLSILPCRKEVTDNFGSGVPCLITVHININHAFVYAGRIIIVGFIRIFCCCDRTAANRNHRIGAYGF